MDRCGPGMVAEFAWAKGMDTSLCGCEGAVMMGIQNGLSLFEGALFPGSGTCIWA